MNENEKIAENLRASRTQIARSVVERMFRDEPEAWQKYGEEGKKLSIRDMEYHMPYLEEAILSGDPSIFLEYVEWTQKLFSKLSMPADALQKTLAYFEGELHKTLPEEEFKVVKDIFAHAKSIPQEPAKESHSFITSGNPYYDLAEAFHRDLLKGDRNAARKRILEAVENGAPVKEIYLHVFQPSQYQIGQLWLNNQISVAKEHFASAATQQIMAQLYPYIFSSERIGKTMLAATVGGELHEMGIRMVADFFEMEGWDTYYLGANTPEASILESVEEYKPHLVALSAAMPFHRSAIRKIVHSLKKQNLPLKIMVGGRAVRNKHDAIEHFKADGYAANAQKAVEVATKLVLS